MTEETNYNKEEFLIECRMEAATNLLADLMDGEALRRRLLDRRPSESAVTVAQDIVWNDGQIPEMKNLNYANELNAAMVVQMARMKSVFSTAWDIKIKEKNDLRRANEELEKTLADFQVCNNTAKKLGAAIESNLHSYIDQVLPHLKIGCWVYDVLQTYAEKVRNFCMKSSETTQRIQSVDPPIQYGPPGELKDRLGLVGGSLYEVVNILEKFKENPEVGRFPKLVKVGEDLEEDHYRMEVGSSDEGRDGECLSNPTNQSLQMPVGENTKEKPDEDVWDQKKSDQDEREVQKGTSPGLKSEVAHASEPTMQVTRGSEPDVGIKRRRGRPSRNELVAKEPAAKVPAVKKDPQAVRPGLRKRSSSVLYAEDNDDVVEETKRRSSVRRGSGRGGGSLGQKPEENTKCTKEVGSSSRGNESGRGGRSKTTGRSSTVIGITGVDDKASVGQDVPQKPCSSTSLNVSVESSSSSMEAFQKPRKGKHGEKKSTNWGPYAELTEVQKWAVDAAWPDGETFCRVCNSAPAKDYKGFVKHMAQVHSCGKPSEVVKYVAAKTRELNKRISKRREEQEKFLEDMAKKVEEEKEKARLESKPKESDVIGQDGENKDD